MEILESLGIILIVALLGIVSRKTDIFSKEDIKPISSFLYYFAMPALFFVSISTIKAGSVDFKLLLTTLIPMSIILLSLYLLKRLNIITKDSYIVLSLSICFGSHTFFAIPFFESLYGGKWLSISIIMGSVLGFTGIILTLFYFEYGKNKQKGASFLLKIIKNPLILSIVAGLIFSYFNFQIELLNKGLSLVGKTAGGLAIFSLGIFMYDNFSVQAAKKAFKYSLLRMIVLPVITYIVLLIYTDIDTGMRMFLFLQSGIPAAISLSVFADRYNYKLEEITGIVIITSAFSFVGLLLLFFISNYSF